MKQGIAVMRQNEETFEVLDLATMNLLNENNLSEEKFETCLQKIYFSKAIDEWTQLFESSVAVEIINALQPDNR